MAKAMKRIDVVRALRTVGAMMTRQGAEHEIWSCPCGKHRTAVPRHQQVSPGVVRKIIADLACLQEGWLQ